jgi:hypothetical protein
MEDFDFEIMCANEKVTLHQCILWARAPKFLEFEKIETPSATFQNFVVPFLYENTLKENMSFIEITEVLKLGKKMEMERLVYLAQQRLLTKLHEGTSSPDIFEKKRQEQCPELETNVLKFLRKCLRVSLAAPRPDSHPRARMGVRLHWVPPIRID